MKFQELFLKCHDASVFQEKNNHDVLSKVFYDDHNLENILKQDQYFLIGEKGTGKTIIAQYLTHIRIDKNCSTLDFSTIDFETFRRLSAEGYLKFIQADQLWQVLLMAIVAETVVKKEDGILASTKFLGLRKVLQEFYDNRFVPEFPVAIQMMERVEKVVGLSNEYIGKIGKEGEQVKTTHSQKAESPLNTVRLSFIEAFSSARVQQDHVIFIDRIDIKPDDIEFEKFIQALRSFALAVLYLNENVFATMKGRKRIKIVLLVRPDIFDKLNLQNQSARASDNSVILNWDTTYAHHRTSAIFALADRFMGRQANYGASVGDAWDHYVDRDVYHFENSEGDHGPNKSFREFLRLSWFRPRDIIRSLHICQSQPECAEKVTRRGFERSFLKFSDYLYGEVKDFSRFYFSDDTFDLIERFFSEVQHFGKLDYDSFRKSHERFIGKLRSSPVQRSIDPRVADVDEFLQILYSSNIICWRVKTEFDTVDDHWAFRQRTAAQLEPKVGLYCEYAVHYGLRRALRLNQNIISAVKD